MSNPIYRPESGDTVGEVLKKALGQSKEISSNIDLWVTEELLIVVQPTDTPGILLNHWIDEQCRLLKIAGIPGCYTGYKRTK